MACVQIIFKLPETYEVETVHPLAYTEWFTLFRAVDQPSGLHILSPSTCQHGSYREIIEVSRIVCSCHLIPRVRTLEESWTTDNIADHCPSFFFNPYIDMHMYCMFMSSSVLGVTKVCYRDRPNFWTLEWGVPVCKVASIQIGCGFNLCVAPF